MAGPRLAGAAVAVVVAVASTGLGLGLAASGGPPALSPTLRSLGARDGIAIGAAVDVNALESDGAYASALAAEYGMVTPENAMKWQTTEPRPGVFDFGPSDQLVSFAGAHGMAVRGHNLVWYRQNPPWLTAHPMSAGAATALLRSHVTTVVAHYRGTVAQWDVVNEAVDDRGRLRPDVWARALGPAYVADAFRWARAADPSAALFYNDYGIETPGPKADAVYRMLAGLRAAGVPVDGVGFELHVTGVADFDPGALRAEMARFAALGLQTAVTEMDVRMRAPATAGKLAVQASDYAAALAVCRAAPSCHTFVTWGFTDADSWIPGTFPGYGSALPFDSRLRPKPAALALQRELARRP